MWAVIGKLVVGLVLLKLLLALIRGIYSTYVAHIFRLNLNISKTGKWAVVTGSTDGIGKAYALELAQRGLNIVLISRTQAKLLDVAKEIKERYPVEVKTVAADFTRDDIYEGIGRELKDLDIGVLINNVGMSYEHPEYLSKIRDVENFSTRLVNINITSVNRMTLLVLPGMEERRRGLIVNVSSLSAVAPTPLLTLYAASKAYVDNFSRNLALEVGPRGVTVQCVIPGFVTTKLSKMRHTSWSVPSPQKYVKQAIATVGVESRTGGFVVHKLMIYLLEEVAAVMLPSFVLDRHFVSTMKLMRKKGIAKMERDAKAN